MVIMFDVGGEFSWIGFHPGAADGTKKITI